MAEPGRSRKALALPLGLASSSDGNIQLRHNIPRRAILELGEKTLKFIGEASNCASFL
jgi:hypothetical protein